MKQTKRSMIKIISIFLSLLVIAGIFILPVSAMNIPSENVATGAEAISSYNPEEDSTFVLSTSNVQISDDYLPETTYISEVENPDLLSEANAEDVPENITPYATVGDPMVYLTQKWLNQEYGNVPGFGSVPENGKTGWDTVYGLTRALQHELGITALADNFGPTTERLYGQNPLHRQDGVTNRQFAILQGALWCKGYSPGYHVRENADGTVTYDEIFDAGVESAIIQLKKDAGFTNPDGVVTVNVMKALLSMDSFKLLTSYGGDAKVRAMQQKLNRKYEAYTGLNPCDGVYGRNTNKAIIYALQAEEGLPTSVANGNFGNTTKLCCPQIPYVKNSSAARRYPGGSSGSYYSSSQLSALTELLQFALYVNGFGDGVTDGVFDSQTQQAIRAFQKKYAIPQTGIADKTTWLSLFVSCGDTDRSAKAADCATILTAAKAKSLYDNGYRYIGRYLTGTYNGGISKAITREEAQIIFDAGLNFFPIYQTSARSNSYFTEAQGTADAKAAIEAASKLGVPKNTIIYFAVDYDCLDYQITSNVIPYFHKVHETMEKSVYRTGIYGTRNACSRVSELGYACSSFVGDMSTGFSGNLGFSMPDNWAFDQFKTVSIGSGSGYLEIDKDGFSGRDYGVSKLNAVKTNIERPNITFGKKFDTDLVGPVVDILGAKTPLFKTSFGLDIVLNDLIDTQYDQKHNTYKITIGLLKTQNDPSLKDKNYAEIKEMIQYFGGHSTTATWNKYQQLKSKLQKQPLKLGFDFNGSLVGYMEVDADTGAVKEGGLIIEANAEVSTKVPIHPPIYFAFSISGSIKTTLKFTQVETNGYTAVGGMDFSVQLKGKIGLDVAIANAYAGGSGNISVSIENLAEVDKSLEANLDLKATLEFTFLLWQKYYEWNFAHWTMYSNKPESQTTTYSVSRDDLEFIEPLSPIAMYSNNPDAYKANVQVYCSPKIISLGNNKMLMTYIDDSSDRSAENRTMLMYSVYDGTSWSTATPVLNDGTIDYEPVVCSDGNGGAHILWLNAKKVFSSNVTMDEMSTNMELYYTHWNGRTFEGTTILTNNSDYEMGYDIVSSGNDLSVVWQQNSQNDPFAVEGTNVIYRKQYENGAWKSTETIATNLYAITSIDTTYTNGKNVIAFTAKSNADLSSTDDIELYYYEDSLKRLTNDSTIDHSVSFVGDELYWLGQNVVYAIADGDINSKIAVVDNLNSSVSKIEAIENDGGQKAIVWEQADTDSVKLYGSFYNKSSGEFGIASPLTDGDGVIRTWNACMLPDGNVEFAYCAADLLDESIDEKPYGQLDLIQKSADKFYDISVDPIVTYSEEVVPGEDITLSANVYNAGSEDVTQLDVSVIAPNGDVVLSTTIAKDLPSGSESSIEVPFTLPSDISKTEYALKITPHNGSDISLKDNQSLFTVGYADLSIEDIVETRVANGRQLAVTIKNHGYEIAGGSLNIFDGSTKRDILNSSNIPSLNPGETTTITYLVENSQIDSHSPETPLMLDVKIESEVEESNYANNSQEVDIYPDCNIELSAGTGGTVKGSGLYIYNSIATLIAIPSAGYIFAGWYENGKLLDNLTEECTLTVLSNRKLEARFIPNNLNISGVEIFGTLQSGNELSFTVSATGGSSPYQFEYSIYQNGELCYYLETSINFIEWTPTESGNYSVIINVKDSSNFSSTYTKSFNVT